jgi:hypothetical protein
MKNDMPLSEFIDQCTSISHTWPSSVVFNTIPVSNNPLKDTEDKGHLMNPEDRVHWKSKGLFYAILSNTAGSFQESYKDVFTKDEFDTLCSEVKESTKEKALSILKDTLGKLKKRKYRLSHTPSNVLQVLRSP